MKNILLPFEYQDTIAHIVDCAMYIAEQHDSTVSGLAIHQRIDSFIAQEGSIIFDNLNYDENDDLSSKFKDTFNKEIKLQIKDKKNLKNIKHSWLSKELQNQKFLGDISRVYDLVIVSRPYQELQSASLSSIQTILFDGGRPVLLIPMNKKIETGKEVLISWNCTTESSRAVFASLPILKKANKVTILTVEKVITHGPSGEDVANMLKTHGVMAKAITMQSDQKMIGNTILDFANSINSDLIIKGAYTQSRLREIMFGCVTKHLMLHSDIPIFLVN